MKIAVIGGTGNLGYGLALRWAAAGEQVVIGSRSLSKAREAAEAGRQELAEQSAPGVELAGEKNVEAAAWAELIVVTVPAAAQPDTLEAIKDSCAGKVVVDTTVPLNPKKITEISMPPEGSAGERAARILGPTVSLVSGFHTVPAAEVRKVGEPVACDVLVCGNSKAAKRTVITMAEKIDLRAFDAGDLGNSRALERQTPLLIGMNIRYKKRIGLRLTGI